MLAILHFFNLAIQFLTNESIKCYKLQSPTVLWMHLFIHYLFVVVYVNGEREAAGR